MAFTVLQLVQQACYEAGYPVPSALAAATDAANLQYLNLLYAVGRELRRSRVWSQLKRSYSFNLVQGRTQYQLPEDFYAGLASTSWDQENRWEMRGPSTDGMWSYRTYGYVTVENRKAYRVFGPDINTSDSRGQFWINPTPGPDSGGTAITFDYISKTWIVPPSWAASTAVSGTIYRNSNGNIYKLTTNGTTSTTSPSMSYGQGQDGGVFWTYVTTSAWAGSTAYQQGEYVTNGGNTYICVQSGVSSGGPSGTSTNITDGTVLWDYVSLSAWTAETSYSVGTYVTNGGNKYLCTTPRLFSNVAQKSGKVGPRWTATTETDGTAVWTIQPQAFETLITDSDLCLFDDDLVILGLQWRFMRAKGLDYAAVQAEYERAKSRAAARWNPGRKISLGAEGVTRSINIQEGNFNT